MVCNACAHHYRWLVWSDCDTCYVVEQRGVLAATYMCATSAIKMQASLHRLDITTRLTTKLALLMCCKPATATKVTSYATIITS